MLQLFVVYRDGEAVRFTEPGWFFSDRDAAPLMVKALRDRIRNSCDAVTLSAFFGVGACALADESKPVTPDDSIAFEEFEAVQ